jgi:hypothetical protein
MNEVDEGRGVIPVPFFSYILFLRFSTLNLLVAVTQIRIQPIDANHGFPLNDKIIII